MFDVIWTDPNRELVGERRARKEQERADDGGSAANNERGRPSTSTGSSTSFASVEKQFAFFGSKSLRKKSSTPSKAKSTATTALAPALRRTPSTNTKNQEGSPFGIDSFLTTATSPTIKATTTETSSGGFLPEQQFAESGENSPTASSRG